MSWLSIAGYILLGLMGAGLIGGIVWSAAVLLVDRLRRTTPGAPVSEAPDDEPTVEIRPQARQAAREERLRWRASEAWQAYADADTDWHALEYLATGKRTEVDHG